MRIGFGVREGGGLEDGRWRTNEALRFPRTVSVVVVVMVRFGTEADPVEGLLSGCASRHSADVYLVGYPSNPISNNLI
jgi:hypothetical protein